MSKNRKQPDLDEDIDRREVPALKVHSMVLGEGGDDLFAASVADMDFRAPQAVIDVMQLRLDHGVFGYETVEEKLIPGLCRWLVKRHAWPVDENHVLRAPNVLNALAMAASLFTEAGDGVIIQSPVFFDFFDLLRENNRNLVSNPLVLKDGHYRMDFDDLAAKAADPHTKMMFLCNPHNPVGRVWSEAELRALGEICLDNNILVVADEMHGDLAYPGNRYTPFASLGAGDGANSITCLSPAKTFNIASCSSAFTVVPDDAMRKQFQAENSRLTVNKNNAFANTAMTAAFESGADWLDHVLEYLQGNVDLVRERLAGISGVRLIEPEGTFLLWFDFRELFSDPLELTDFLRENARWMVSRGEAFGPEGVGFARVNIGCTRKKLAFAMDKLEAAVNCRSRDEGRRPQ